MQYVKDVPLISKNRPLDPKLRKFQTSIAFAEVLFINENLMMCSNVHFVHTPYLYIIKTACHINFRYVKSNLRPKCFLGLWSCRLVKHT